MIASNDLKNTETMMSTDPKIVGMERRNNVFLLNFKVIYSLETYRPSLLAKTPPNRPPNNPPITNPVTHIDKITLTHEEPHVYRLSSITFCVKFWMSLENILIIFEGLPIMVR